MFAKKKVWISVILAGVVLLTVTGGALAYRSGKHIDIFAAGIVETLATDLGLSDPQKTDLKAIKDQFLPRLKEMRGAHDQIRTTVHEEFANEQVDADRLVGLFQEQHSKIQQLGEEVIRSLSGFYNQLTPEQRETLKAEIESLHAQKEKWGHGRRRFCRF